MEGTTQGKRGRKQGGTGTAPAIAGSGAHNIGAAKVKAQQLLGHPDQGIQAAARVADQGLSIFGSRVLEDVVTTAFPGWSGEMTQFAHFMLCLVAVRPIHPALPTNDWRQ